MQKLKMQTGLIINDPLQISIYCCQNVIAYTVLDGKSFSLLHDIISDNNELTIFKY